MARGWWRRARARSSRSQASCAGSRISFVDRIDEVDAAEVERGPAGRPLGRDTEQRPGDGASPRHAAFAVVVAERRHHRRNRPHRRGDLEVLLPVRLLAAEVGQVAGVDDQRRRLAHQRLDDRAVRRVSRVAHVAVDGEAKGRSRAAIVLKLRYAARDVAAARIDVEHVAVRPRRERVGRASPTAASPAGGSRPRWDRGRMPPRSARSAPTVAVAGRSVCQFNRTAYPFFPSVGVERYGPRTMRTPLAAPTSTQTAGVDGTTVLRPGEAKTATASRLPSAFSDGNGGEGTGMTDPLDLGTVRPDGGAPRWRHSRGARSPCRRGKR